MCIKNKRKTRVKRHFDVLFIDQLYCIQMVQWLLIMIIQAYLTDVIVLL